MIPIDGKNAWRLAAARLTPGQEFSTWSAAGGAHGKRFTIVTIDKDRLKIRLESTGNMRTLTHETFSKVGSVWGSYVRGETSREDLRELTEQSSYVLTLLHWLAEQ